MFSDNCYENLSYMDLTHSNDLGIGGGAHPVGILSGSQLPIGSSGLNPPIVNTHPQGSHSGITAM